MDNVVNPGPGSAVVATAEVNASSGCTVSSGISTSALENRRRTQSTSGAAQVLRQPRARWHVSAHRPAGAGFCSGRPDTFLVGPRSFPTTCVSSLSGEEMVLLWTIGSRSPTLRPHSGRPPAAGAGFADIKAVVLTQYQTGHSGGSAVITARTAGAASLRHHRYRHCAGFDRDLTKC